MIATVPQAGNVDEKKRKKFRYTEFLSELYSAVKSGKGLRSLALHPHALEYLKQNTDKLYGLGDSYRFFRLTGMLDAPEHVWSAKDEEHDLCAPHGHITRANLEAIQEHIKRDNQSMEVYDISASENHIMLAHKSGRNGSCSHAGLALLNRLHRSNLSGGTKDDEAINIAIRTRDIDFIKDFIHNNAPFNWKTPGDPLTALFDFPDERVFEAFMEHYPREHLQEFFFLSDNAMYEANDSEKAGYFIIKHYPADAIGQSSHADQNTLNFALENNRPDIAHAIIEHYRSNEHSLISRDRFSPLRNAIKYGHHDIAKILLERVFSDVIDVEAARKTDSQNHLDMYETLAEQVEYIRHDKQHTYQGFESVVPTLIEHNAPDLARYTLQELQKHEAITQERYDSYLEKIDALERSEAIAVAPEPDLSTWEGKYAHDLDLLYSLPPDIRSNSVPENFSQEVFDATYPLLNIAAYMEGYAGLSVAEDGALKLAQLYDKPKDALRFIDQHSSLGTQQPLHDLMLFELPETQNYDRECWSQLIKRNGNYKIAKILPLAPQIEAQLYEDLSTEMGVKITHETATRKPRNLIQDRLGKMSVDEFYELARDVAYTRSEEHPELAELCVRVGASEEKFNESLEILAEPKPEKNIPAFSINATELGFKGFTFETVEPDDPINLWVGQLVNCCNYLGSHTSDMAIGQCLSPNARLAVLKDETGKVMAKTTIFKSEAGNIVFNSWERLGPSLDKMCEPLLLKAASEMMQADPTIERVVLGTNRGEANFKHISAEDVEKPVENKLEQSVMGIGPGGYELIDGKKEYTISSSDADTQYEVAHRERLKFIDAKLDSLTNRNRFMAQMKSAGVAASLN